MNFISYLIPPPYYCAYLFVFSLVRFCCIKNYSYNNNCRAVEAQVVTLHYQIKVCLITMISFRYLCLWLIHHKSLGVTYMGRPFKSHLTYLIE